MHVLFLAGRETEYTRNQVMLAALRNCSEVDVIASSKRPGSLLLNSILIAVRAMPLLLRKKHDLVFVGFYGHIIMRLIAPLARCPIVFDAFISTYDTLCFDRRRFAPGSLAGRAAFALDRYATQKAQRVLLDTENHVDYFVETFSVPRAHYSAVPVGCSEAIFRPAHLPVPGEFTKVLYYSSFLSLHGVDVILQAAARLRNKPIRFRLIGEGPTLEAMKAEARRLELDNLTFESPISPVELAAAISASDICLGGHFSTSGKAARVIPGKAYQALSVGRPLIIADAPGNREIFNHNVNAILVPPVEPVALADAILELSRDAGHRQALAEAGRALFREHCSETVIFHRVKKLIAEVVLQPDSGRSNEQ